MGEDRLWMGQEERDRLKVLHEVKEGQLTQKQGAEQLQITERHLRRVLKRFRAEGDGAVIHGLRGRASNRKIATETEQKAIAELNRPECHDFGPTYATEYLCAKTGIRAGKDTVRKWMVAAGLWQAKKRTIERVHRWRERRPCAGELVQWD